MTVLAIVLGLLAVWLVFTFNKLVGLKNQVLNAFRQIDVQLKRRHDLIPNLVNSVKGEMKFEKETLENVIQARAAAVSAGQGGNMNEVLAKEGMLTQALGKLFALTENYPNLKSIEVVRTLMEELRTTE
ncbi:MAG TPA: LemA family protein, partial [Elusimicrobiales bacterium]|nr:LemA family protein [Elusimicrobiales bacterium]